MTSDGDPLSKTLKARLDPPLAPNCTGDCDDDDACTADHCDPQDGCISATMPGCAPSAVLPTTTTIPGGGTTTTLPGTCAATDFEGVACVCAGGISPAECASGTVPKSIGNVFRGACTTMQRASTATRTKKMKRLVRQAAAQQGAREGDAPRHQAQAVRPLRGCARDHAERPPAAIADDRRRIVASAAPEPLARRGRVGGDHGRARRRVAGIVPIATTPA